MLTCYTERLSFTKISVLIELLITSVWKTLCPLFSFEKLKYYNHRERWHILTEDKKIAETPILYLAIQLNHSSILRAKTFIKNPGQFSRGFLKLIREVVEMHYSLSLWKSFDSLSHGFLLFNIERINLVNFVKLISNFLSDRKHKVKMHSDYSDWNPQRGRYRAW